MLQHSYEERAATIRYTLRVTATASRHQLKVHRRRSMVLKLKTNLGSVAATVTARSGGFVVRSLDRVRDLGP